MLIKSKSIQKGVLLAGSYYFYAYWDWRFCFLIFLMSFFSYIIGLKIEKSSYQANKKKWLIFGITVNLIILGFFKYYNFFIDSLNTCLKGLNFKLGFLEILLPVGISFITFEVISYTVDIYRGKNKSADSFWDLAMLVAFFPHLISGPILKPSHFLPQLRNQVIIKWPNAEQGIQIFLMGMVKKVLIADQLSVFVDTVYKSPALYSPETIWFATIAYAIQIFCDFSGYTDMAIGSAKCLGFDIPANFNMPYISGSITEFWRRWHISLSTWLKEYLYISLGGNRCGKIRQYLNLMIVMLLGGLWHGASWNFVIWGGLHGGALALHKMYSELTGNLTGFKSSIPYKIVAWFITFVFVCFTWVFFRAKNFETSGIIIKKMFFISGDQGIVWFSTSLIIILPLIIMFHYFGQKMKTYPNFRLDSFGALFLMFFVILGLFLLHPTNFSPFIYFQF
jgi:alginate O-acetyltransferase complex protein AlgI